MMECYDDQFILSFYHAIILSLNSHPVTDCINIHTRANGCEHHDIAGFQFMRAELLVFNEVV